MTDDQRKQLTFAKWAIDGLLMDYDGSAFADVNRLKDALSCLQVTSALVKSWLQTAKKIPVGKTDDF